MNLDSSRGVDAFMTKRIFVNGRTVSIPAAIEEGGFPDSGGATIQRQDGKQFTVRVFQKDYPAPAVHDAITEKDFGSMTVKQAHPEGDMWAIRATGKVVGRKEI